MRKFADRGNLVTTRIDFKSVSDADLYEMLMRGDNDAWTFLYNMALRMCQWYLGKFKWRNAQPDADDLASDVCEKLMTKGRRAIRSSDKVKSYTWAIVRTTIIDKWRVADRETLAVELPRSDDDPEGEIELGTNQPEHEDTVFQHQVVELIDRALARLPDRDRRLVEEWMNLHRGKYSGYDELSRILEVPVPTISARVSRSARKMVGFKELRDAWEVM
jgi:RNA polymerase sigma factor (sigma-70 family)